VFRNRRQLLKSVATVALAGALGACASERRDPLEWGRQLALANCAACHAIGSEGGSINAFAPPFRDLRKTYDLASIELTFGRAQVNDHPPMPSFAAAPEDVSALMVYIKSVQSGPPQPWPERVRRRD
jgi:mono/diheme cytochrome c family protein